MVQPCQADLGNRSRAAPDDQTRIASQGHEKVSGISHAARDEDAARPIPEVDIVGWHDADDHPARTQSPFGCSACGRTTAAANHSDSEPGEQFTGRTREIERGRSGLCASEDTHLTRSAGDGVSDRASHVVLFPFPVFCGAPVVPAKAWLNGDYQVSVRSASDVNQAQVRGLFSGLMMQCVSVGASSPSCPSPGSKFFWQIQW